jgi:hypothetical protein
MQARDWFGVAVRIAALVFLALALFEAFYVVAKLVGLTTRSTLPLSTDLVAAVFYAIFAALGLFGADWLVNISYRTAKRD